MRNIGGNGYRAFRTGARAKLGFALVIRIDGEIGHPIITFVVQHINVRRSDRASRMTGASLVVHMNFHISFLTGDIGRRGPSNRQSRLPS